MTSPSAYVTRVIPRTRRHRLIWWRAELVTEMPTVLGGISKVEGVAVCWSRTAAAARANVSAQRRVLLLEAVGVNVTLGSPYVDHARETAR